MRKAELDQLLETAVARALGVNLPAHKRAKTPRAARKPVRRPVRRAA